MCAIMFDSGSSVQQLVYGLDDQIIRVQFLAAGTEMCHLSHHF